MKEMQVCHQPSPHILSFQTSTKGFWAWLSKLPPLGSFIHPFPTQQRSGGCDRCRFGGAINCLLLHPAAACLNRDVCGGGGGVGGGACISSSYSMLFSYHPDCRRPPSPPRWKSHRPLLGCSMRSGCCLLLRTGKWESCRKLNMQLIWLQLRFILKYLIV